MYATIPSRKNTIKKDKPVIMAFVSCADMVSYAPDCCSNMFAISKSPVAFCPCAAICFSIPFKITGSIPVRDNILSLTGIEPVILNGIEKQIAAQGQKATGDFDMANILLQQSGAYDTISAQLTNAIMTGLSFFIVFFLLGIVAYIVRHIIRKIERVPVIGTVNRIAGFAVGFIKGMVIVWLLLALTSLFAASEIGQTMTAYINDSMMLKYLYENNPVIKLIENIL